MRNFWALPAALRVALAAQVPFSVQNDILAFPQYEVIFSESFIPEAKAQALLSKQKQQSVTSTSLQQDVQTQQATNDGEEPESENRDSYERIMFEDLPHLCTIPYVAPAETDNTTKSEEEQQQELARASDHGWELLQGMRDQSCLYYAAGWWVYSFCYNDGIKQFHPLPPGRAGVPLFPPVEDESIASFTLGKFEHPAKASSTSPESSASAPDSSPSTSPSSQPNTKDLASSTPAPPTTLQTRGSTSYLAQTLSSGTKCDLTGRPRRIEVQFHCNPSKTDHISMIKETASCVYLMVIHTPRLCNDVAFLPQQVDKPNPISCREIVAEDGVEEWKAWKTEVMREEMRGIETPMLAPEMGADAGAGAEGMAKPAPLIIGGIEVGAQKLVGGSPERTIKASKIVSNQHTSGKDDKFLATLARFDGEYVTSMSEKDMEKLGMKGLKEDAAKYRKLMSDKGVNGVPWKLELWSTPTGEEFRMFIGSEDVVEEAARHGGNEVVRNEEKKAESKDDAKEEVEGSEEEYR